jgi:hypothetical protein
MPLKKSASKEAFSKNVSAEMRAGKPQPQSLAIAYSVQRKAKKKKASGGTVESGSRDMNMAEGGEVNAKNERRPMPNNTYDDTKMANKNRHMRDNGEDGWTDKPTEKQAVANNGRMVKPIKRPRMVPSDAFSTKLYDQEGNLQATLHPSQPDTQPDKDYDEDGANRQGPKVPDMADTHSTHKKPYAKGGEVEEQDYKHPKNKYEHDLTSDMPSEDEGEMRARHMNELRAAGYGPDVPDMEDAHSTGKKPYAGGGKVSDYGMEEHTEEDENPAHDKHSSDDSEDQPEDEEKMEDEDSIAAAIMAKKHPHAMSDSDMDEMINLYEGGEITEHSDDILSHGSMDSDDSDQADLSRNHDEDANEEDQASWNALRKENYNDSDLDIDNPRDAAMKGDSEESDSEDDHDEDMVSAIRRNMKKKQFKSR